MSLALAVLAVPTSPMTPAAAAEPSKPKVTERPDRTSAMVTAIQQDSPVEDLSARTPSSAMFANPDGTWTLESYAGVVRSETDAGEWVTVDPSLKPASQGTDGVEPTAVPFSVDYGDGGSKDLATVTTPGGGQLSIDWATKLPDATVDDTTLTFTNPGAGTATGDQVVVTSHPEGFNFSVTLDQAPTAGATPEYRFPLNLTDVPGGRFKERADGTIDVITNDPDNTGTGEVVATITAPVMWDSATEPSQVPVTAALEGTGTSRELVLRPDPTYLADPARVYPVTVDPTVVLAATGDTWVQNLLPTSSQYNSAELRVGTNSLGVNQSRSYLTFDISSLGTPTAASVANAKVTLSNFEAGSCSGQDIRLSQITSAWTVTGVNWATQPAITATGSTTTDVGKGATGCTTEGPVDFDATAIVKSWVGGATNYGVQIKADNAGVNASWRKYRSLENGDNTKAPKLTVTINQAPNTPTGLTTDSGGYLNWIRSTTPTLSTVVTDPDGGQVKGYFEVRQGATVIWSGTSPAVASGGTASIQVPAGKLVEGGIYGVYAYAEDDLAVRSATPTSTQVKVDSIAPTVTVTSNQFTNGSWKATTPTSDTVTYTGSADTGGFWVSYDGVRVASGANSSGVATFTYTPKAGWHTLEVTPVDRAGNSGTPVTFAYGSGTPAFTTPAQWTPSTASFPIDMSGKPSATSAKLEWRMVGATTWTTATKVKKADGTAWTGTITGTSRSTTGPLVWNATQETYGSGTITAPALLEVRGCFAYSLFDNPCTSSLYLPLYKSGFGAEFPTTTFGPVDVALTSGEAVIRAGEAADSQTALGRSFASQSDATLTEGVFGPGWSDPYLLAAPAADAASTVIDSRSQDGSITIVDALGGSQIFVPSGAGTFEPLRPTGDATALTFTAGTPDRLELTRPGAAGATVTTWEWITSDTGGTAKWTLKSSNAPGASNDVTITRTGQRPTFVRTSDPTAAATCTAATQTEGCRALKISYTGTGTSTRVSKVERVVGAATVGAVTTKTLADYTYTAGKLTKVCGPAPVAGGVALCTEYTYVTVLGRTMVATLTPPGQTPWRLGYDSLGRLQDVKRQRPASSGGGDATWSVDYSLTTTSAGLPDMSTAKLAEWGQTQKPTKVYAIYGPHYGTADITKAKLAYTDANGIITNTASYGQSGWLLDATWYDSRGNTVQYLDRQGWARVQASPLAQRPRIAADASSYTIYNTWGTDDVVGTRVVDQYGPARTASLEDGTIGYYRTHTSNMYDDDPNVDAALIADRPGTAGLGVLVKETTSTATADRTNDYDVQVTKFGYAPIVAGDGNGWDLDKPTSMSVKLNASTWSTAITRYNSDGNVIEERRPGGGADGTGSGNDARSTVTTYYTATGTGDCGGKREWAGLVCKKLPAAQPVGTSIPGIHYAGYDSELNPTVVRDLSAATINRTRTTTFDDLGRPQTSTTATSGTGVSADTITTTYGYSPTNGRQTTLTSGGQTITTGFDAWSRPTSYTDANGNSSTISYNAAGDLASETAGTTTKTYTYDTHGFNTSTNVNNGVGTFEYTFATDGGLTSIKYPNNITLALGSNEVGDRTAMEYSSAGTPLLAFNTTKDASGRALRQSSTSSSQTFAFDGLDRLTKVEDTRNGACTTRTYDFTASSDRSTLKTFAPGSGGACQNTTFGSTTDSQDAAGRLTNSGYAYDNLGRTLTVPASDTAPGGAGALNASYRANDMVSTLSQDVVTGTGTENRQSTYGLDPANRISTITNKVNGAETNRLRYLFGDASDAPSTIQKSTNGGTSWSTLNYITDTELGLVAESNGTDVTFYLINLHGDIAATASSSGALQSYSESEEYGTPVEGAPPGRYSWLGSHQRSTDTIGGLVLMGVRLYNSRTGTFLSQDPVLAGNSTPYGYPQDPINLDDISGECVRPLIWCSEIRQGNGDIPSPGKAPPGYKWVLTKRSSHAIGRDAEDRVIFILRGVGVWDIHQGPSGRNRINIVYPDGSQQLRIYDISAKWGSTMWYIEVKANGSRYTVKQQIADQYLGSKGWKIWFIRIRGIPTKEWVLVSKWIA